MKTAMCIEAPGQIEFTLTVTMPLYRWEELSKQLSSAPNWTSYPACDLITAIREMTRKAATEISYEPGETL